MIQVIEMIEMIGVEEVRTKWCIGDRPTHAQTQTHGQALAHIHSDTLRQLVIREYLWNKE